MEGELLEYLKGKGIFVEDGLEGMSKIVIEQLQQKDKIIANLSGQITKYKCEDIKNQKLIKTLQDKLAQLNPSVSDTGSNFMMASEFKTNFQQFMTTVLPSAFGGFIDRPFLFSRCVEDIFEYTYSHISSIIAEIVNKIRQILGISQTMHPKEVIEGKIKLALIKILQQFCEVIVPFDQTQSLCYTGSSESQQLISQLNQVVTGEDFLQMRRSLHRLAAFMILQEKPWQFVNLNKGQLISYCKKQYICLDGWIKQGESALLVLEGLRKDGHMHANLKNYVIPYNQADHQKQYGDILLKEAMLQCVSQEPQIFQKQKTEKPEVITSNVEVLNQISNFVSLAEETSFLSKNKSAEFLKQDKENNPHYLNKKAKKKEKIKPSLQNSLKAEKSPRSKKKHDQSVRAKKVDSEEHNQFLQDKIQLLKDDLFAKVKKSAVVISSHVSNNHDIIFQDLGMFPMKRKPLPDLPVSKEIPRKKTKPVSSRKNSVGKIVSQHNMINQRQLKQKQNCQNQGNGKIKTKEKVYKDIIKQKLLDQKCGQKIQLNLSLLHPKAKTDRQRKKEENRPLKIQGNANKLREKYIN